MSRGLTGLVYGGVRHVTSLVGKGLDAVLGSLVPLLGPGGVSSPEREAILAALNGVLGDHLAKTENPLAIGPSLRRDGRPFVLGRAAPETTDPGRGDRVAVFVHGLCMNDLQWNRGRHDHAAALERDLGYLPVHFHYNSGLHVSENGRALAGLLERMVESWPGPLEELVLVGHSMGGLVSRSACHYAAAREHRWPKQLRALVTLGSPHHGAPLERIGNWVGLLLEATPYASHFARLGRIRSAGITDLRYGNLLDEDWKSREQFARGGDPRHAVPPPEGVSLFAIAARTAKTEGGAASGFVGDGLVPVESALGRHRKTERDLGIPASRRWEALGTAHLDLLSSLEVYERLRSWMAEGR
jgi:pimeloyl-ACP methyl ester carboxylesterase